MLDKERLYRDLEEILGGEQQPQKPIGIYVSTQSAFVWAVVFIFMLLWIGIDLFDAAHATHSPTTLSTEIRI